MPATCCVRITEFKGIQVDAKIYWKLEHLMGDCSSLSIGCFDQSVYIRQEGLDPHLRREMYKELYNFLPKLVPYCLFGIGYFSSTGCGDFTWKLVFSNYPNDFDNDDSFQGRCYQELLKFANGKDEHINEVLGWEGQPDFQIRVVEVSKSWEECKAPDIDFSSFVGKYTQGRTQEKSPVDRLIKDRKEIYKAMTGW